MSTTRSATKWLVSGAAALVGLVAVEAGAAPQTIGTVEKVQEHVLAMQGTSGRDLERKGPLFFKDRLRTGEGARLEAKLEDGTVLTLGEKGKLTLDEFVYRPGQEGGKLALSVPSGAFLFVGGKIEGPTGGNVSIKTPVGTLGVRGTTVWGGPIDGGFGVLVLDGEVTVTTKRGAVTLQKGQGTMVYANRKPQDAGAWPQDRTARAVKTITFEPSQVRW